MPLSRVNTSLRSKSRSPAPPSPRPAAFLPPSHYAEAGGLTPRPPAARQDSIASSSESQSHTLPLESRRSSVFMPISSNSDSSFEFAPRPENHSKRFSISAGATKGAGAKGTSSFRSKRESHMTNLPLVEAQLLPSLRDTIDRMTRPPSRMFPPQSSPSINDGIAREVSPESSTSPRPDETPLSSTTPTQRALKSALRAPTPKLQLRSPKSSAPPTVLTSPISRAPPNAASSSSGVKKNSHYAAPTPSTPKRSRPRSRTDPGAPLHSFSPAVPQAMRSSSSKASSTASAIPRPRATSGLRSASFTPRPQQPDTKDDDSSSDFEIRCELAARDQRSLRVVNGAVSSESDSDADARDGVGLGLGLAVPYTSRSFASKLRARLTRYNTAADLGPDEAADKRREELLGLVNGLDKLGSELQQPGRRQTNGSNGSNFEYEVTTSGSAEADFTPASDKTDTPRVLVSSSSGTSNELGRDVRDHDRISRPLSFWKRSRCLSPALPPLPQEPAHHENKAKKSPSRSPVIKQPSQPTSKFDEPPAALRRHSVYYSPSPPSPSSLSNPAARIAEEEAEYTLVTQSPQSVYEEEWLQEARELHRHSQGGPSSRSSHFRTHERPQQSRISSHRHSDDLANSDAVLLALNSKLAAAREREAFGIPPSASDACHGGERMSFMDSGSSLARVGMSMCWEDGDRRGSRATREGAGYLSLGAEKLFRTLSGRTIEVGGGERGSWSGDVGYNEEAQVREREPVSPGKATRSSHPFSESDSDRSIYEDEEDVQDFGQSRESWRNEEADIALQELVEDAWRSTLSASEYAAVVDGFGSVEIHRQETIHMLCVTETAFVARLTNTINIFILPLRMQDSKDYIAGVPAEIGKLFDWLEDILNLHAQLLSALQRVRENQELVVERVADAVRSSFVKRLEVYQPYLARLVNVAGTIARLVADTTSDFGEFVRIQESVRECRGWSLEALLVDPVNRLGSYPATFRKLQVHTPKTHVDYVPTFSLLHSTEMIIKVMTEVKIREDEYDLVKSISQRIRGLSSSASLAKRGRRLLYQGELVHVDADESTRGTQLPSLPDGRWNSTNRESNGLPRALHELVQRRDRSGSSASSSTSSYSTTSSTTSSGPPVTPSSPRFSHRSSIPTPKPKSLGYSRPSTPQDVRYPAEPKESRSRPATNSLRVFVFTDCVVIARAFRSRQDGAEEWSLIEKIGIVKVLTVTELPDEINSVSAFLQLDVLPVDIKNLEEPSIDCASATLEVLHLRLPAPDSDPSSSMNTEELHKTWLSAFQQSSRLTVNSLSIPKTYFPATSQADAVPWDDTQPQRTLHKSPSLIAEVPQGSPQTQEREEREWWSLRFHQVLREFQYRDVS